MSGTCSCTAPESGKAYLRTSGITGSLIPPDAAAVPVGSRYWEYIPRIYYIRRYSTKAADGTEDGIPTLVRKSLQAGAMVSQPLVEGVENFRITSGASSGTAAPLPVTVHVLARSLDRDPAYNANQAGVKTYSLGGTCFTTAGAPCTPLLTVDNTPQHYYRRVFASTVAMRNPGLLSQYQ